LRKIVIGLAVLAVLGGIIVFSRVNAQTTVDTAPADNFMRYLSPNNDVTQAKATDRGRVQIAGTTVVADNGYPLRGEHVRLAEFNENPPLDPGVTWRQYAYDTNMWLSLINDYHLNTVRLLLYRPPQNWTGGSCDNPPGRCYNSVNDALTYIDDMVEIASQLGMYLIIDYHPVGGYDKADAIAWWTVLAPRYKNRTHVLYELSNEPVAWSAAAYNDAAIQFEEDLYQLIRAAAPDTHIILWSFAESSGDGNNMLTKVQLGTTIDYGNASVGYHPYQKGNFNQNEIDSLRDAGYAVIDTEIGDAAGYRTRTTSEENQEVSWIWLDAIYNDPTISVTWAKDPKTVSSLTNTPVQGVTISGGNACPTGLLCGFSADVSPASAAIPITFTWQATGQSGVVHQSTDTTDNFSAQWNADSTQTITVTADNGFGIATDSRTITVKPFNFAAYLPLILKNF